MTTEFCFDNFQISGRGADKVGEYEWSGSYQADDKDPNKSKCFMIP